MAPLRADDLLAGYPVTEGVFDEAFSSDGEPRPHARAGLEAVARADAAELPGRIGRTLQRSGVRFSSVEGDLQFYVDPVPRVITASDWEPVKRGLAQRVRALNAFVADVYGDQRIVAEGVIPREVITSADYYEEAMRGVRPPSGVWIGVAGLDIVRDHNGEWLVLEDNVRTPSGFAYLHATRRALLEHIDVPPDATPRPLDGEIDLLTDALRAAAPESARGRRAPAAAVLTDGEQNSAYWEHAWLSRQIGIPLITVGRARGARQRALAARPRAPRAAAHRRDLPPHERRPPRLRHRPAADRARAQRRARPGQPVRHRRRRRQAHARLRRADDPLLRRRGAGPALRPDLRPRAARRSSRRRSTSSTSSCSSRAPGTAASAC